MEKIEKNTIQYKILCAKLELARLNEKNEDPILYTESGTRVGYKAILTQEINDLYELLTEQEKNVQKIK